MRLSIVIPAYNESEDITQTITEFNDSIKRMKDVDDCRFIVVDDHSFDDTYEKVEAMRGPDVTCVRLNRRCGSHTALRAGIGHAYGDAVLCISADGQDNPEALPSMLKKWQDGLGVVWALRRDRGSEPWHIRMPAEAFYKLIFLLSGERGSGIDLSRADFFLLDRKVADAVNRCPERNTSIFGLIVYLGFSQDCVEYERRPRRHGKSKWPFNNRLNLAKDWIVAFSGLPLRLASLLGVVAAATGFIFAVYMSIRIGFGDPISPWSWMTVSILIVSGIQMVMLGIIGGYLWRNLEESRRRPLYFIERETGKEGS